MRLSNSLLTRTRIHQSTGITYRPWMDDLFVINERRQYSQMLAEAGPDDMLLDVGANIGVVSSMFAPRVGSVVAVEPDPDNLRLLHLNVDHLQNVVVIPEAVSLRSGARMLWRKPGKGASRHSLLRIAGRIPVVVPCVSLTSLLEVHQSTLLKIDVEGYEYALAPALSALPSHVRMMSIEMHVSRHEWRTIRGPLLHRAILDQGFDSLRTPNFENNAFGGRPACIYRRSRR